VFIRYAARIPLPVAECERELAEAAAGAAGDRASVGFKVGPAAIRKRVRLELGVTERLGQWTRLPVAWKASPGGPLFPVLEGYLQLEPLTPHESRLTLKATYQPPLGRLGQAIDEAAMHAAARATVKDFVDSMLARLLENTVATTK
jgi:hypothetical protein